MATVIAPAAGLESRSRSAGATRAPGLLPWVALAAAAAAVAWWLVPARAPKDAGLVGLVRAFALLKVAMLAGAFALLRWRVRQGIEPARLARYGLTLAVMAIAPVLGWRGTAIPLAFACFDGGLIVLLLLALADDGGPWRVRPR